jgi:hypothetical protein
MALNPNIVVVAPGDLITSTHLNNVRSNIVKLDTEKAPLASPAFTGVAQVGGNPGTTQGGMWLDSLGRIFNTVGAGQATSDPNLLLNRNGTAAGQPAANSGIFVSLRINAAGTVIGSITVASSTSVAYNTTSDPRAKTAPPLTRGIDDAAGRVQAIGRNAWQGHHLNPETGEPDGGPTWDFVSSHDVEDQAPYAVYGERGAGDDAGAPVYQQVSYGDLVPLLFAALTNALDRIDALEAAAG